MLMAVNMTVFAQFSPGKLSKPHAKMEGLTNCTSCHTIGAKVSNQKCLDCHEDLSKQITRKKGYHASRVVRGKDCISCHSEHHGLNFEMIRFDKKSFDHTLTGYELKGAHKTKVKDCSSCHKADNIADKKLKNKTGTFLGLETKCLSCHEDYHQKTLSTDCAKCHEFESFKPATLFNHNDTKFALRGKHKEVECTSCHKSEIRNGENFNVYSNLSFANCTSCHKDEHKGKYGSDCKSCHNEESFHSIHPSSNFNHTLTGYKLEGKHASVSCTKCHNQRNSSFQEFSKTTNLECITCHEDKHEGKLGEDCKSCHNQNSFLVKNSSVFDAFDHNKTIYPLKGKHDKVECRDCHKERLTDPLPHDQCISCHSDKHNGDFDAKKDKYPDCASCHKVEGFSPSLFTIEQHRKSNFPLEGSHLAQPCFSCHFKNDKWDFSKNLGKECVSCHEDIHQDSIDRKYYGTGSCTSCHSVETWRDPTFDHSLTSYPLKGGHLKANCGGCHMDYSTKPVTQTFKNTTTRCSDCHKDIHGKQFDIKGVTDCSRCHEPESWEPLLFDHDKTEFKLDGKHIKVACNECHKASMKADTEIKLFKIEKFECIDCHLQ